jgi:hypothetical protein
MKNGQRNLSLKIDHYQVLIVNNPRGQDRFKIIPIRFELSSENDGCSDGLESGVWSEVSRWFEKISSHNGGTIITTEPANRVSFHDLYGCKTITTIL